MTDIIDRIDAVTAPVCASCTRPLRDDGPSGDFCGETCAETWRRRQGEPLDDISLLYIPHPGARTSLGVYAGAQRVTAEISRMEWTDTPPEQRRPVAQFLGGARHGQTIGLADPPPVTIETVETVDAADGPPLFTSDHVTATRRVYRRDHYHGDRWYYIADGVTIRPIPATDHHPELTVEYLHQDSPCDRWAVRISDGEFWLLGDLPNELLHDTEALAAWFVGRKMDAAGHPSPIRISDDLDQVADALAYIQQRYSALPVGWSPVPVTHPIVPR